MKMKNISSNQEALEYLETEEDQEHYQNVLDNINLGMFASIQHQMGI